MITLIGIIAAPYFLEMINTPEEIMGIAVSYRVKRWYVGKVRESSNYF